MFVGWACHLAIVSHGHASSPQLSRDYSDQTSFNSPGTMEIHMAG